MRTPKAGEHWVWKACDKHRFNQLRDLVVCLMDFEDRSEYVQSYTMEFIKCGCQYPADDPEAAIAALRRDEAHDNAEFMSRLAMIGSPTGVKPVFPLWVAAALLALLTLAMIGLLVR
jgi:hypothetical protein